jgi:hypothetical protein
VTSVGATGCPDGDDAKAGAVVIIRAASASRNVRVIANSKWGNPENSRDTAWWVMTGSNIRPGALRVRCSDDPTSPRI